MTPEREAEIRELAARFTASGSKHARIGAVLVDLLSALDEERARPFWVEPAAAPRRGRGRRRAHR
jgi:hypothetical protein